MIQFDPDKKRINKIVKNKDGDDVPKVIANFAMSLQAFGYGKDDNAAMLLRITSPTGSCLKVFTSKEFSSLTGFQSQMVKLGFSFMGSNTDVSEILDKLLEEKDKVARLIYLHDLAGRYHKNGHDFIVMLNGVLDSIQGFLPYGELGDVTLEDGTIVIANIRSEMIGYYPTYQEPEGYYKNISCAKFFKEQWYPVFKNSGFSVVALGWFFGSMFIDEVLKYGNIKPYPFLFIAGKTGMGKTELCRIIRKIAGFNHDPIGYDGSTDFSDRHEIACCSALPVWRDEYKNTVNIKKKEPTIRGFYDRSGTVKGTVTLDTVSMPVRGTMMFSGEDISEDPANQRRNVTFFFGKGEKHTFADYRKFLKESNSWPMMVSAIYKRGREVDWSTFEEKYETYLSLYGDNPEIEFHEKFAVLTAIFDLFMGKVAPENITKSVTEYIVKHKDINMVEDSTEQFFEELGSYFTEHNSNEKKFGEFCAEVNRFIRDEPGTVAIYFKPLYGIYSKRRQMMGKPSTISQKVLKRYFTDTFNAKPDISTYFPNSGMTHRAIVFDKSSCPESLLSIIANIRASQVSNINDYEAMNA